MLTYDKVRYLFNYNLKTGLLFWKHKTSKVSPITIGSEAGCVEQLGYRVVVIYGKNYKVHRIIWLYMKGYFPENDIDHIDRNKQNNKWDNLREVSRSCSSRNRGCRSDNKTGFPGITIPKNDKDRYYVKIMSNKKREWLGSYKKLEDAVKARWLAEVKYGYPDCYINSISYSWLKERNLLC